MDETPLISGGDTGANGGGRRLIDVGLDGHVRRVVNRLGDEDAVERHDDAVVVLDVRREFVGVGLDLMVVIFEVCVRDQAMPVRPVRLVYVVHRSQRQSRQSRDEADRKGAKSEHYACMLRDRSRTGN